MASIPRYIGTDAATARAFLCAALNWSAEDFLRVFDLDGDGAVTGTDETAFVRAVCMAETEVDEALVASHGAPFTGAAITDSVREIAALRVPWCAVRGKVAEAAKSGLFALHQASDKRLDRLAHNKGARIPSRGAPEPVASVVAAVDPPTDEPAGTWADIADGRALVGF